MTPQIHLYVLASGSKGNAYVVAGPEGAVLVDCGISLRELRRRAAAVGAPLDDVRAAFLTHEHSDHVAGLSVFCNHFDGKLYATAGTVAARRYLSDLPFSLVDLSEELVVCGMRVRTFPTSHDVADPIGLRFSAADDALGICTDTGVLTLGAHEALAGCRVLALESNHDRHMLATGPYPAFLKARVGGDRGHLSNDQAAEALRELVGPDTETVVAMHLSEKNNRPAVAIRTLAAALDAQVTEGGLEARTPDGRLTICAASQTEPLAVW